MIGVLESMELSLVAAAVSGDAGTGVEVEEEKKEKEGEIDGEVLSLVAVSDRLSAHHPLPLSLIGLAVDHKGKGKGEGEEDDGGDDGGGHGSHRADGGSGDMGVKQLEGKVEINMKMEMKSLDDIGCHQETSLNVLNPPLVASIMHEVETKTETEMWTLLPPHAHSSDAHSDSAPSDHLSTPSMIKCEDQSMTGEEDNDHSEDISLHSSDNNCISLKADNDNSNICKDERRNHESDSVMRNHNDNDNDNDNHNHGDGDTNDEPVIESQRLQKKEETSDFSSPYKTQQQVLMWKSWGKDIDWSKMKFQGNSEIYTKAQESLSKSSGRMMRNVARES